MRPHRHSDRHNLAVVSDLPSAVYWLYAAFFELLAYDALWARDWAWGSFFTAAVAFCAWCALGE